MLHYREYKIGWTDIQRWYNIKQQLQPVWQKLCKWLTTGTCCTRLLRSGVWIIDLWVLGQLFHPSITIWQLVSSPTYWTYTSLLKHIITTMSTHLSVGYTLHLSFIGNVKNGQSGGVSFTTERKGGHGGHGLNYASEVVDQSACIWMYLAIPQ